MACFIVPATEAAVVTVAYFAAKKSEQKVELPKIPEGETREFSVPKIKLSKKLSWLLTLLWGGVLLLAFEHLWHGEIQPFPPFITAAANPSDTAQMLQEMMTVGVAMAVCVTAVWGMVCAFADFKIRQLQKGAKGANT